MIWHIGHNIFLIVNLCPMIHYTKAGRKRTIACKNCKRIRLILDFDVYWPIYRLKFNNFYFVNHTLREHKFNIHCPIPDKKTTLKFITLDIIDDSLAGFFKIFSHILWQHSNGILMLKSNCKLNHDGITFR